VNDWIAEIFSVSVFFSLPSMYVCVCFALRQWITAVCEVRSRRRSRANNNKLPSPLSAEKKRQKATTKPALEEARRRKAQLRRQQSGRRRSSSSRGALVATFQRHQPAEAVAAAKPGSPKFFLSPTTPLPRRRSRNNTRG